MKPLGIYNFDFSISLNVIGILKVLVSGQIQQIIMLALLFFSLENRRNDKLNKVSNDSQRFTEFNFKPLICDQMYYFTTFFFFFSERQENLKVFLGYIKITLT